MFSVASMGQAVKSNEGKLRIFHKVHMPKKSDVQIRGVNIVENRQKVSFSASGTVVWIVSYSSRKASSQKRPMPLCSAVVNIR